MAEAHKINDGFFAGLFMLFISIECEWKNQMEKQD